MYPSGYTQDTSRYIRIRILITNPPKLDNKPPRSRQSGFRRNHQKSRSAILQRFCGIPLAEKRDVVVKKNMSDVASGSELGRALR